MQNYQIHNDNIKDWAKNYNGPLFDGILCDPPYELGFMGKSWDSSGIAFDVEMWKDILKLLKPGGHLLAFSGSRTYHRMAVAIEDAGFEIRDQLIWMYGSGFPKSLNIGKALDKAAGAEREVIGHKRSPDGITYEARYKTAKSGGILGKIVPANPITQMETAPSTDEAKLWNGYGTALKPAHEPCVLARKPIDGTVANNVLKHGTGGLNIDGTRVGTEQVTTNGKGKQDGNTPIVPQSPDFVGQTHIGRFPANLIHDGSDEVEAVFPQTGKSRPDHRNEPSSTGDSGIYGKGYKRQPNMLNDSGSASRFFYCAKSSKSERNAGLEGFEEIANPKTGSEKRITVGGGKDIHIPRANHHPTVKPLSLTKYLATLIKPPTGGRLLVPFSGSGSEMIGALQAGWEYVEGVELTEEYIPIAEARIKYWIKEPKQEKLL